jgi:GAF domain.
LHACRSTLEDPHPRKRDSARPPEKLNPESVVWSILRLDQPPYYRLAEDRAGEDALLGGRFVRDEEIQAAMGIQLRVGERRMGVMFVDFRSPHRFTSEEIATIQLFADQAAVAIRNTHLYQQVTHRIDMLQALYQAGQAITGTLSLQEVLDQIAIQARRLVGDPAEEDCFSHLALVEGHVLHFAAACTPEILAGLREKSGGY